MTYGPWSLVQFIMPPAHRQISAFALSIYPFFSSRFYVHDIANCTCFHKSGLFLASILQLDIACSFGTEV